MHQKFEVFFKNHPELKQAKLLLAISGGVDSMVLWQLLEEEHFTVDLAHVNFQLRGEESEKDQNFLNQQAKKRNAKLHLLRANTKDYASEKKLSTQIAAREIRYNWFEKLMQKHSYDYLLTGHHLDDSIETFFINLDRGTGLKGLSGIQSKEKVLRPLLDFTKSEIQSFAKDRGIPFREDASNADSNYLRNWFRNELLPLWKTKNPAFEQTMKANLQRLKEAQKVIDEMVIADLREIPSEVSCISFEQIRKMKLPKQSLMQLFEPLGFNFTQVEQLLDAVEKAESGKVFFSESQQITVDREQILITEVQKDNADELLIDRSETQLTLPFKMQFSFINKSQINWNQKGVEYFDAEKLQFPLKLRKWQNGDRIKPLGMQGSKLVSDLLIDEKVPLPQKSQTYVLLSGEQLIAVLGLRISENAKVTDQTKSVWQIQWED